MKDENLSETNEDYRDWYNHKLDIFNGLAETVTTILTNLLINKKIEFLSVNKRVKTFESFVNKIEKKVYQNPTHDVTDFVGIRVITFIESDVKKVIAIINDSFKVYPKLSVDKGVELGENKMGYRSVHFICELGQDRCKLPEFSRYNGYLFEIQIRTVLQHAWAEIEHDRSYKFSGVLPKMQQRRLNLVAGILELADREFNSIAQEIDSYAMEVETETVKGNLDFEINSTSLFKYLQTKSMQVINELKIGDSDSLNDSILELKSFGIDSLDKLDKLIDENFLDLLNKYTNTRTAAGFLRRAMMYHDVDKYFTKAWRKHWHRIHPDTVNFLVSKYSKEQVNKLLLKHNIKISDIVKVKRRKTVSPKRRTTPKRRRT